MELGTKLKVIVLLCLVLLVMALPAIGGCAPKEKVLSDLVIKVDWVMPVSLVPKPFKIPMSLASEYNTFHVLLSVTNPNDFLVTVESIEAEVISNDISMGVVQTDGPIYLPAGKGAVVRFSITQNTLSTVKQVVMAQQKAIPDAVKITLGTWKAIQDGTASYQARGIAHVTAGTQSRAQNFDLRWP